MNRGLWLACSLCAGRRAGGVRLLHGPAAAPSRPTSNRRRARARRDRWNGLSGDASARSDPGISAPGAGLRLRLGRRATGTGPAPNGAWDTGYWAPADQAYLFIGPRFLFVGGRPVFYRPYWQGPGGYRAYGYGYRGRAPVGAWRARPSVAPGVWRAAAQRGVAAHAGRHGLAGRAGAGAGADARRGNPGFRGAPAGGPGHRRPAFTRRRPLALRPRAAAAAAAAQVAAPSAASPSVARAWPRPTLERAYRMYCDEILVLEDPVEALAHVGGGDGDGRLSERGRLEARSSSTRSMIGVQAARADVLHPRVDRGGDARDLGDGVVVNLQRHLLGGEQRDVLLGERVLRLGQDAHEVLVGERLQLDADREPPLQLGDQILRLRDVKRARRDEQDVIGLERTVLGRDGRALDDGEEIALDALARDVGAACRPPRARPPCRSRR